VSYKYKGTEYRSKFEVGIAKELTKRKVGFTYETHTFKYEEPLRRNNARCADCDSVRLVRIGWYTPDFFLRNGTIIEGKGRFTAADRRKQLAVQRDHPELDIKLLFMRNNRIDRRSTTTYADWAEKNGFDYSIGTLKEEWLV